MASDLLPPNATPLERALSSATARQDTIGIDVGALWNPQTCPIDLLPWLAWALSIDRWDPDWSELEKRAAVAAAIDEQRHKGTRYAVEQVLSRFDDLLQLVEWFEVSPKLDPFTFEVRLPLVDDAGGTGGTRVSAEFALAVIAEVSRAKPARAHFALVHQLELAGGVGPIAAAQVMTYRRIVADTVNTGDAIHWDDLLQDENGEPLFDDTGAAIDGSSA